MFRKIDFFFHSIYYFIHFILTCTHFISFISLKSLKLESMLYFFLISPKHIKSSINVLLNEKIWINKHILYQLYRGFSKDLKAMHIHLLILIYSFLLVYIWITIFYFLYTSEKNNFELRIDIIPKYFKSKFKITRTFLAWRHLL